MAQSSPVTCSPDVLFLTVHDVLACSVAGQPQAQLLALCSGNPCQAGSAGRGIHLCRDPAAPQHASPTPSPPLLWGHPYQPGVRRARPGGRCSRLPKQQWQPQRRH